MLTRNFPRLFAGEGASEGGGEAAGSGSSEPSSGTQGTADPFAGDREKYETRVRQEQARADRAEAELRKLTEAGSGAGTPPTEPSQSQSVDPEAIVKKALDEFRRGEALRSTAAALKADEAFKYANSSLFEKAEDFDSPEALTSAVEASHNRVAALVKAEVDAAHESAQRELAEKYGIRLDPAPANTPEGTPKGDPTIEEISRMSFAEKASLDPEVLDRVLRSAN